jgi:hypothetical protein
VSFLHRFASFCYDASMRKATAIAVAMATCGLWLTERSAAQAASATGTLEFTARITPTGARAEPVRQFTFYLLTKSYTQIVKEVEEKEGAISRDAFIDDLNISPQLRAWLKSHDIMDLSSVDLDKSISPDDIIHVPEFLLAYQHANAGGVTPGLPQPKYVEADKTAHPEKYEKQRQDYLAALKKFVESRPETVSGVELELESVNPQRKWAAVQSERRRRVQRAAPDVAQIQYLAAKVDTDLDGQAAIAGVAPGKYWISSLDLDAGAGDVRLRWDVPVTVEAGKTTRIELMNLNSIDAHGSKP